MKVSDHFENWDNFTDKCSVSLHAVDGNGTILWANDPELKFMGYEPQEYLGRFIGDFHVDKNIIDDILARLTRDETLNAYPARLRAKDGSIKYVMINSNVYRTKGENSSTRGRSAGRRLPPARPDGRTFAFCKKLHGKRWAEPQRPGAPLLAFQHVCRAPANCSPRTGYFRRQRSLVLKLSHD